MDSSGWADQSVPLAAPFAAAPLGEPLLEDAAGVVSSKALMKARGAAARRAREAADERTMAEKW
jgi:hypothetical protein